MADGLSSAKRKYIENWRQTVSIYMENGNICRTTIAEVTPEPQGPVFLKRIPGEPEKHPLQDGYMHIEDAGSPVLPVVKFSYCHAEDDVTRQDRKERRHSNAHHNEKRALVRSTTLPPSPNGVIVQNGMDVHITKKKNVLKSVENRMHNNNYNDHDNYDIKNTKYSDSNARRSSKTAREIYEKYNMKSKTQNLLMRSPSEHGVYSMPWRNKTFLSLPLRFNGNIPRKQNSASHMSGVNSDIKYDDFSEADEVRFTRDWTDVGY